MKFISAKCPSCNGELQVPDDKDFVMCMYCGTNIKVRDVIKVKEVPPVSLKPSKKFKEGVERKDKTQTKMYGRMWVSVIICIFSFILLCFTLDVPVLSSLLVFTIIISFIIAIIFFFLGAASGRSEAEDAAYKMTEAFEKDEEE